MLNPELVTAIGGIMATVLIAFVGSKLFQPGKPDPMSALIKLLENVDRQSGLQTTTYGQNMEYLKDLNTLVNNHLTAMNLKLNEIINLIHQVRFDSAQRDHGKGQ